jgi:hypothetical protein
MHIHDTWLSKIQETVILELKILDNVEKDNNPPCETHHLLKDHFETRPD